MFFYISTVRGALNAQSIVLSAVMSLENIWWNTGFKVRLHWFGADLRYSRKHRVFLSSFDIPIGVIYH